MKNLIERYIDPEQKLLNSLRRDLEPTEGDFGWGVPGQVRSGTIDEDKRRLHATLSDPTQDRYGEGIDPRGCLDFLPRFQSNPVLLADHNHDVQLGHWEDMRAEKAFDGWPVFANDPAIPKASEHWALYRDGHRKAFSVGFIGHKWEMRKVEGTKTRYRWWTVWEPVEGSSVSVPANPNALVNSLVRSATRSVAVAWADTPDELAAFYDKISQELQDQVTDLVANTLPENIKAQLATFSQSLDARLPGMVADALDLLAGRNTHARLFDRPGSTGDGITPAGDTVSPETTKALADLNDRFKR